MQNHLENRAYAGFFVRMLAYAVDSLIAAIAVGIVKLPFSAAAVGGVRFLTANFIFDYSLLDVLGYVGVAAYFVLLTYFTHSTPGKLLFRLEVITEDGEWTFFNVLYRETVGRFLSSLLCIGYLVVLVQDKKQGFHDMLCDTYVVYRNMQTVPVFQRPPAAESRIVPEGAVPVMPSEPAGNPPQEGFREEIPMPSAFEVSESHPIPAEPVSKSYDNMNPDSTNLNLPK